DIRTDVDVSQALKQRGGPALGRARGAVDHEVLGQAGGVDPPSLHREHDARVALDVLHLLPGPEVGRHQLVAVDADPDAGDLCAAVVVHRHEVSEVALCDQGAHARGNADHPDSPPNVGARVLGGTGYGMK